MATDKQRRAFISYSRINKEFATKLTKGLRAAGYPVWFDQLDIPTGARWDDEVEKALRECSIFMVILTPSSIASENVKDEIGYAIDHGKRILPVLLEDCDVPLRLRRFQYVDFTAKNFEEGFASAKELLGDLIGEVSVPVPAKTPVVEAAVESKPAPVKAKPAPAAATQKKPVSLGLIIGIVAVVVLVVGGIGISALSNRGTTPVTEPPFVSNPATEAPAVENLPTEVPSVSGSPAWQVSGFEVNRVEYEGDAFDQAFVQGQSGIWLDVVISDSYTETRYEEVGRDEWSVYLYDGTRNYNIHLDLYTGEVLEDFNDGNGETQRDVIKGALITPTGYAVAIVRFDGGEFNQVDDVSWVEKSATSDTEFYFTELGRDEWSVYLYDESRNYNLHLDLYQNQIYLDANDGNGEFSLYQILSAENQ